MTLGFRTKVFIASLAWRRRRSTIATVHHRLGASARRARLHRAPADRPGAAHRRAALARSRRLTPTSTLDDEADRLAQFIEGRVTLIAADGRVLGDSTLDGDALAALENHLERPEIQAATAGGIGVDRALQHDGRRRHAVRRGARLASRRSRTCAWRCRSPAVAQQLRRVGVGALVGVRAGGAGGRRGSRGLLGPPEPACSADCGVARRYGDGDLTRPAYDYGDDELGAVARVLDASVQELGAGSRSCRATARAWKRSSPGMVEGVLVVDRQGRLQLVNRAAQEMLHVDASATGRPYLEVIRHPDIAAQLATALARRRRRQPRAGADARPGPDVRRTRGGGGGRRRRRRGAGAARHHRPAARRSDPPRLRRQRLARAAHAADGDPRLRRGAARRPAG